MAGKLSAVIYDDPGSIEQQQQDGRVKMNRICIRRLVNTFFVLYRHMHCWKARVEVQQLQDVDCGIKLHHILAASDDFSKLSMHWDLMPAAKINYVHDFRGLFNCISQVIYFHNPQYERRIQERKRIEDVSRGAPGVEMVQLLAPIMQLHPDILVEHEDSSLFADEQQKKEEGGRDKKWAWLVMGRTIYLCSPVEEDKEEGERTIYHHPNVAVLLQFYKRCIGMAE